LNGLALCAGVGGLELGLERVFPNFRTLAYVEGEAFAASNLVKKMEEGRLDQAPIWSDLRTFEGKPWRGKVDLISAGFPCQPFSLAGMRKGTEDERHLWPSVSRIIGEVRPSIIVLENVPGVLNAAGLGIFGDLSQMGYDLAWGIVRASEAGAPHQRARFFAVAINTNTNDNGRIFPIEPKKNGFGSMGKRSTIDKRSGFANLGSKIPNLDGNRQYDGSFNDSKGRSIQKPISNTGRITSQIQDSRQFSTEQFITRSRKKRNSGSKGWQPEPGVGRVVDGVADWMDRLRACGNGVVPQQAELAIRILLNTLIQNQKVD